MFTAGKAKLLHFQLTLNRLGFVGVIIYFFADAALHFDDWFLLFRHVPSLRSVKLKIKS